MICPRMYFYGRTHSIVIWTSHTSPTTKKTKSKTSPWCDILPFVPSVRFSMRSTLRCKYDRKAPASGTNSPSRSLTPPSSSCDAHQIVTPWPPRDGSSSSCDTLARSRLHDSRRCRLSLVRRPRDLRDLAPPRHRLLATSAPSSSIPIRHHRADATGCCRLHDHRRCAHTTQQDRQVCQSLLIPSCCVNVRKSGTKP